MVYVCVSTKNGVCVCVWFACKNCIIIHLLCNVLSFNLTIYLFHLFMLVHVELYYF